MTPPKPSLALRTYLKATGLVPLFAKRHLKKRLALGKEHPTRWREKLGEGAAQRPQGTLIWLHAVGLGEVLGLRGIIDIMGQKAPDAHFLVTSSTLQGADAFASNMPPRTIHQFLPLDAPGYRRRFLDHWRPDLCLWSEQDLWPGFVTDLSTREIPQAIIAARMDDASYARHARAQRLYAQLYARMARITAGDDTTRGHLTALGAENVTVTGSLKPTAPPLRCDADALTDLQTALKGRLVWITAPSHAADEAIAIAAHKVLLETKPNALLIIAPRFTGRDIRPPLTYVTRSKGEIPTPDTACFIADTTGELGLFYRLAHAAYIGGTNDDTEGHNPWEAVALDTAIFHGPRIANFANDYRELSSHLGAMQTTNPAALAAYLKQSLAAQKANALHVLNGYRASADALADDLLALLEGTR